MDPTGATLKRAASSGHQLVGEGSNQPVTLRFPSRTPAKSGYGLWVK